MIIVEQEIREFSLEKLLPFASESMYFDDSPGREHYKLLAYPSTLVEGALILDIGTYQGYSALALSYNIMNHVISIGPEKANVVDPTKLPVNNITFLDGIWEDNLELLNTASLIVFDTSHDGEQEPKFIQEIRGSNFKGLIVFDDINLNYDMKKFWEDLKLQKYDLTHLGHASGTGLVVVDKEVEII